MDSTETAVVTPEPKERSPWTFTPLLYLMQAIPVALVQEVSTIMFKSLGVENSQITLWTSLIALPWSLQMLLGPFVDFNGTKRGWILGGQAAIVLALIGSAFALQAPNFFGLTIGILGTAAIFSALCNIATDGFYILALSKEKQAAFIGLNSTFYRLGRLLCTGLLVYVAGTLMRVPNVVVEAQGGQIVLEKTTGPKGQEKTQQIVQPKATLLIKDERLQSASGLSTSPIIKVPPGISKIEVYPNGAVAATPFGGEAKVIGNLTLLSDRGSVAQVTSQAEPGTPVRPQVAWAIVLGLCIAIYGIGRAILPVTLPRPTLDIARPFNRTSVLETLGRTLLIIGVFLASMIALGNIFKFIGHWIAQYVTKIPYIGSTETWVMDGPKLNAEGFWLAGCLIAAVAGAILVRQQLRGTEMGEAFTSFIRQDRFAAIFGFILFYRFGEVMVGKITPLFYQDPTSAGGLALTVEQVGVVNGVMGVVGIILGGITGGLVVSKLGLRKAFWPLALAMHIPNLLYLWAAKVQPTLSGDPGMAQIIFSPVSAIAFVDQFGYGFGFAAYMVYLMWVAQRGKFQTSHYAIGTGLGALCIAMAGIFSGIVQKQFGYFNFYLSVIFFSIPGMLMLLVIPLDEHEGRDIKVEAIGD